MRARKSWLGMRLRPAGQCTSKRAAKLSSVARWHNGETQSRSRPYDCSLSQLTAKFCACFGAGRLAQCKPRLDAGSLVAAVEEVSHSDDTQGQSRNKKKNRSLGVVGSGRGGRCIREAVLSKYGVAHDFKGEIPEAQLRQSISAC